MRDYTSTFPLALNEKRLQLPPNVKHLVGYFFGLVRSLLFSETVFRRINDVEYLRRRLINCQLVELINSFYPRVFNLLDLDKHSGTAGQALIIPITMRPSK